MIATDGATPLDAAHIHQFKRGGSNEATNGIALCKPLTGYSTAAFGPLQTI
jgi:hypothetical protein